MSLFRTLTLGPLFLGAVSTKAADIVTLDWFPNSESDIAGYRFHYGTSTGAHTEVIDTGGTASVSIPVQQGIVYYCSVSAYNIYGLESHKSSEVEVLLGEAPGIENLVIIEPESGTATGSITAGAYLVPSFIGFIETLETSEEGTLEVDFQAPSTSAYAAWLRVKAPDFSSDSIRVGIDLSSSQVYNLIPSGTSYSSDWTWVRLNQPSGPAELFSLNAGTHTLYIDKVDANVIIDRMLFTSDLSFIPTDQQVGNGEVLIISQHPQSTEAEPGEDISISVNVIATTTPTYQWLKNGQPVPNSDSPTLELSAVEASDAGEYCVELETSSTVISSDPAFVTIEIIDSPQVSSFSLNSVGETMNLTIHVNGDENATVEVFASEDLVTWESLGSHTLGAAGIITTPDPEAENATKRFYKIIETVPPSS